MNVDFDKVKYISIIKADGGIIMNKLKVVDY